MSLFLGVPAETDFLVFVFVRGAYDFAAFGASAGRRVVYEFYVISQYRGLQEYAITARMSASVSQRRVRGSHVSGAFRREFESFVAALDDAAILDFAAATLEMRRQRRFGDVLAALEAIDADFVMYEFYVSLQPDRIHHDRAALVRAFYGLSVDSPDGSADLVLHAKDRRAALDRTFELLFQHRGAHSRVLR